MAEYRVIAPRKGFSGEVCGIVFQDGAAIVSDERHKSALNYFKRRGYDVQPLVTRSGRKAREVGLSASKSGA